MKALMVVVPILVIGGGVVAMAKMGKVNIPGLSPKPKAAKTQKKEDKPEKPVVKKAAPKPKEAPTPKPKVAVVTNDPQMGQQKVAQLWAEMGVDPLLKIIADWKNEDLAPILSKMDNEKVTKLLEAMAEKDAKRASMLTKAVQSQASKVNPETVAAG